MSKTILFIIPSAKGHLHPCFGLARILQKSGYNVLFALPQIFQNYVLKHEFQCVTLDSLPFAGNGEKRSDEIRSEYRVQYIDSLIDRFYEKLLKSRVKEINTIVSKIKPDIILLDSFQSSDFVIIYPLLKQHNIKFAFIQIMLSFRQQKGSLPLSSHSIPNDKTNFGLKWMQYYAREFLKSLKDNILYLGRSNYKIIEREFRIQKVPELYSINKKQVFRIGFNNIPEFITTPQELEFTRNKEDYQIYLGSVIDHQREKTIDPIFSSLFDQLKHKKNVIYCSLGTIYTISNKSKSITRFFLNIVEIAKLLPEYQFVISLNKEYSEKLGCPGENIHFSEHVPQLLILSIAALFITHGGSQSVKESIRSHVPMLVYPMWWDQPGFAARVEYYGLGLRGKLGKDSSKQILEKIKTLTIDKSYRQRVEDFDEIVTKKYTESSILKEFEDTLKNQIIV